MSSPIAEIPPRAPRRAAKKPPRALSILVGVGLALGFFDLVLRVIMPTRIMTNISPFWENIISFWTMFIALSLIHFIPLILTLRGVNWARWTMVAVGILGIVVTFLNQKPEQSLPLIKDVLNWLYVPYYLALIAFLLTPAMHRYFKGGSLKASQKIT